MTGRRSTLAPINAAVVALILGVLSSACQSEGGAEPLVEMADSAGVPVILNPAAPDSAAPGASLLRLADAPTLEIGLADGAPEYLFYQAFGGLVLSDGRIVVANSGTFELRFYDATGKHLLSTGREGDAPGEFRDLRLAGAFTGDSLLAYDLRLRRATIFGPDGALARSYSIPEAREATRAIGVLEDGSLVLGRTSATSGAGGTNRAPMSIDVLTPTGEVRTTLGTFAGRESQSVIPPNGGYVGVGVPFGRDVYLAASGDRVIIGTNDAFSLRHYGADGSLVRLIRQAQPPVAVDPAELEMRIESMRRPGAARSLSPYQEQAIAEMPRYETMPAFNSVYLGRSGHLWVRMPSTSTRPNPVWHAFDPEGAFVGRVDLPEGSEVRAVGEDYVLLTVRDDVGVERVRLYRLEKGSTPEAR